MFKIAIQATQENEIPNTPFQNLTSSVLSKLTYICKF